jgi:hypothetical protein
MGHFLIAMPPARHDSRSRYFAIERHGDCRSERFCFEDQLANFEQLFAFFDNFYQQENNDNFYFDNFYQQDSSELHVDVISRVMCIDGEELARR